jgi:hypothetical protein
MTDPAALSAYLDAWFRYVDWPGLYLEVRGLGEKGTPKEGVFRESHLIQPDAEAAVSAVLRHVERWSEHDIGSFIVPSPLLDTVGGHRGGAREQDIALMLGLIVDLDKGDTDAGLRQAESIVGRPSIVVRSGGTTATGHPKRHVYWRFSEPCSEVDLVAGLRKHLALAIGGDPAFGRCTQIIRIPGSVHAKNGERRPVTIECLNADAEIEVGDVTDIIRSLPLPEGAAAPTTQGVLDFSKTAGADRHAIESVLTSDIAEGGQADRNRWSEFTRTAGWEIHLARTGVVSLSEAADNTRAWMHKHMQPPWPEERFRSEFMGLVNHDIGRHGPFPNPPAAREPLRLEGPGSAPAENLPFPLAAWAVGRTMKGQAPPRKFLIDGLIPYGKPQLWVAEGGVGKTWMLLQLGMAVASGPNVPWLCSRVSSWMEPGGKCVLLLAEDDHEEMHARLAALDPTGGFRAQCGDNLIVLPLPNMGGAFSLVEMDPARNATASRKWRELVEQLKQIPDLRLVCVDTYSALLHGEENATHIAMEWCRVAIEPICGDIGATMIVTHHVRKASEATVIRTGRQMRDSIRGATALPNATRSVFGMWPDPDWKQHMKLCGMEPREGVLFKAGIIKGNNPELKRGEFILLREPSGELRWHEQASEMKGRIALTAEKAWLLFAIREAAKAGFPFTKTGRNGLAARRGELPDVFPGQNKVISLADELITAGLVLANRKAHLDVPGGRFVKGEAQPKDGAWEQRPKWNDYEFDDALCEIVPKGATP